MRITKFGHCCLLVEVEGLRILTDPGMFSTTQNDAKDIDVVLITHEHSDHFHTDSVKAVLANNPNAVVITNTAVGKLLKDLGHAFECVEHGQSRTVNGVLIEGFGKEHAAFYPTIPNIQNTGYFIANTLFFPGDAFTVPGKPVQVLAVPIAGPWLKFSEVIDFARANKAVTCFPVHEAIMKSADFIVDRMEGVLASFGIRLERLAAGEMKEF